MEAPKFKEVLNFRFRLSCLHSAHLDIRFKSGSTKAEFPNSLTNKLDYVSRESIQYFFVFRPHPEACGILVLLPGMEPILLAVEVWSFNL